MTKTNKEMLIYKIIFTILVIVAIIIFLIILKKRCDDKSYDKENLQVVEMFHQSEKEVQDEEICLEMSGHKVIGIIKIPVINLEYPIIEYTTKETMKLSISKFCGGNINDFGNVSLAGHNNYSGTMFGKNKNLKIGDKIYLTDLSKKNIEYEIYDVFVTNPNDTTILETKDDSIREITLITCKNGRSERLIIKAKQNVN